MKKPGAAKDGAGGPSIAARQAIDSHLQDDFGQEHKHVH